MSIHLPWCATTCTGQPHTSNPVTTLGGKTMLSARLVLPDGARDPVLDISAGWLAMDRGHAYLRRGQLADWWTRLARLGRHLGG